MSDEGDCKKAPQPAPPQPPVGGAVRYVLLNMVTGSTFPLFEGRNVIGRSPSPVDDIFFINLESPRSAISRLHAMIEVARNGDVWIYDSRSTNGTHISVREGTGVTLEPERFYLCVPGCRILFGDVELTLVVDDTGDESLSVSGAAAVHGRTSSAGAIPSNIPRTLSDLPPGLVARARSSSGSRRSGSQPKPGGASSSNNESRPLFAGSADHMAAQLLNAESGEASVPLRSAAALHEEEERRRSSGQRSSGKASVPYLHNTDITPAKPLVIPASTKISKSAAKNAAQPSKSTKKHQREDEDTVREEERSTSGQLRASKIPRTEASAPLPVSVCLSGFDSKEKEALSKLVKARRGTVVEGVTDNVDVLVVKEPPTRTPKFLIAVGRGVPVVTASFLESSAALSDAFQFTPDLLHNGVRYTSKKLQHVTQTIREKRTSSSDHMSGVLDGDVFYLSDAVGSAKQVLVDVIKGCGGQLSRKKGDDAEIVTDPDEVYHKILTGGYVLN